MELRIIGAGLPRTGTMSLKYAIEHLLGGSCYHMDELYRRPEHVGLWNRVLDGETDLLTDILQGYCAALDWPVSAVWNGTADLYPDAKVLLSFRAKPQDWWDSVDQTVWEIIQTGNFCFSDDRDEAKAFSELHEWLTLQFCDRWDEQDAALAAYSNHLKSVREITPVERLVEFEVGDGWRPLCRALDVEEPSHPFPNKNNRVAFKSRNAL
ncbi:sulfotransferase family protein [Yoonia sp. R2-816]|uniref:sulfotransferase family protein n=1 Tax=Yoonia sp. R2-816 TaxID=3342638 RepID=UPI0037267005